MHQPQVVKGRITHSVIGENMIAKIGEDIAKWLGYSPEEARKFTSHTFRRSAATMLVENGVSRNILKLAGGWRSDRACEGYINDSTKMKRSIADLLAEETPIQVMSKSGDTMFASTSNRFDSTPNQHFGNVFNISNISHCQFHISLSPSKESSQAKPSIAGISHEIVEADVGKSSFNEVYLSRPVPEEALVRNDLSRPVPEEVPVRSRIELMKPDALEEILQPEACKDIRQPVAEVAPARSRRQYRKSAQRN